MSLASCGLRQFGEGDSRACFSHRIPERVGMILSLVMAFVAQATRPAGAL
jgi:hypothetical protein